MTRPHVLLVFVGGGLGAALRAIFIDWLAPLSGSLPFSVLLINLSGAFGIALVASLADETTSVSPQLRLFLTTGVMGGFTTFSTLVWGADLLFAEGASGIGLAVTYLIASVAGGVVAVALGQISARKMARWRVR